MAGPVPLKIEKVYTYSGYEEACIVLNEDNFDDSCSGIMVFMADSMEALENSEPLATCENNYFDSNDDFDKIFNDKSIHVIASFARGKNYYFRLRIYLDTSLDGSPVRLYADSNIGSLLVP